MANDGALTSEGNPWTKPAFLRRVCIRGYKSIAACDVPLQPLTIVVGRNAAGKSNFLDALAFLRDVVDLGAGKAVKQHGGWSSLLCRTTRASAIEIEIEADLVCGPLRGVRNPANGGGRDLIGPVEDLRGQRFLARYSVELVRSQQSVPMIRKEQVSFTDDTGRQKRGFRLDHAMASPDFAVLVFDPGGDRPPTERMAPEVIGTWQPDAALLGRLGMSPFIDLADSLRWMGFYNVQPAAIRALEKPLAGELLRKDGSNLASIVRGLEHLAPSAFLRVQEYLGNIAPDVRHFEIVPYGEYETVRFHLGAGPTEFDAASMSDGTLRALCNIMAAFQYVPPHGHPSVVGIEEPETALHPAALRALVDALREATQHTQIVLTTHNPDLLADRYLDTAGVLVARNCDGVTQIAPVDPASWEIVQKELYTLADLQRMDHLEPDPADLARQAQALNGSGEK